MPLQQHLDSIYEYLANEEDARVCRDLSAEACRVVPHNFFLIIAANTLSKLADSLANPKTVLAWMLEYMQAPLFLIGLLVPIRESGSMIPQLVIASWIRRMEFRKWAWIAGSLIQAASVTGMGITALYLQGHSAGWLVIGLLVLFSLGRGLCSVAFKDVLGKTIAKTRRGLLGGYSASISGWPAPSSVARCPKLNRLNGLQVSRLTLAAIAVRFTLICITNSVHCAISIPGSHIRSVTPGS